ncbi:outer envelope pore protein 16-4, chloroplastic isoform X2 [Brassica napus]|uniref:outer envelope pore protein 16-4, chloroplastic isoform X2 n=1 Tax=Brassica napus TaxID=3708 RepID=UPI00207AABEE|nr:outer envelope pore protein 16-4, chloroplastic isoform X2 [Brassica napus]
MEDELLAGVPCSSRAVESVIRVSTAGGLYGFCAGPRNARKLGIMKIYLFLFIYLRFLKNLHLADELKLPGLSGVSQASYVAKSIGKIGFQCDAGYCRRVYKKNRAVVSGSYFQVNALVGGAVAGAAVALRTRNCSHVVTTAGLVSIFSVLANSTRTDLKQQH